MLDSFAAPWTVACQVPLSMLFPRQEYWSGLPFPSPEDLSWPWDLTCTSCVSWIGRKILYQCAIWEDFAISYQLLFLLDAIVSLQLIFHCIWNSLQYNSVIFFKIDRMKYENISVARAQILFSLRGKIWNVITYS